MTTHNPPETQTALDLLNEVVLTATLHKLDLADTPDDILTLAGPSRVDLLALAGSSPDDLMVAAERGTVSVAPTDPDITIY
ncbi:hypothetical protein [Nocardioides bizhenqiangii]|uniref:Halobacterial output domain-containing protein n=1 Tax=Nocardioides bizhenqiangii TaxID=3095076 RepID=A0ABZ0ZR82_9ACTN|nr:hypothetical protein [Nocardioides sp. HM61]WQQ26816.1 hypothetical protein SHK19_00955 [Nocardioides sp. HM61]